ncbi:MAG: HD domain-containing protein [Clostridium sp.]
MERVRLKDILIVIHRTINSIDQRLLDHGEQVAYIMMNLLKAHGGYNEEEIRKICTVSIFHDIGAYKVAERDKLVDIDSIKPFNHAVYGALFIKYFSPISDLADIVMGHHFTVKHIRERNITNVRDEALMLSLADYLAIIYLNKGYIPFELIEDKYEEYLSEHISLFKKAVEEFDFVEKLKDNAYKDELYNYFEDTIACRDEVIAYARMLTYAIDFRSEYTVKHSITVEAVSYQIAKLYGLDNDRAIKIKVAANLHDIGKIVIPIDILEKPGKLTVKEYEIIKSHAKVSYDILSGLNIDDIRDIAGLHHETLDGCGYPFGIQDEDISIDVRIVAIADILSALIAARSYKGAFKKCKVVAILNDMKNNNKIDKKIVDLVIENYDFLIAEANKEADNLINLYENLKYEYANILDNIG